MIIKEENISIIIRTKNSAKTIQSCIEHIHQQTTQIKEIIIVDSGSTDSTLDILDKFNCNIVHYPKDEPFNYSKALNIGISTTVGTYILNLSSHIILDNPKTIEFMMRFLKENSSICTVSSFPFKKIEEKIQIDKWNDIQWEVNSLYNFNGIAMYNPCALFKKELWEEHCFCEAMPACEDQEWVLYFMEKYGYGSIVIYNPFVKSSNPYLNVYKSARDKIVIGRYLYPPILEFRNLLKIMTWRTLGSLFKLDLKTIYSNYYFVFLSIREKLGLGIKITSNYNKKLKN